MADTNSKKYLSGDGLKYALQQLKAKTDELYVSEQEIFKTVQSERSFSGSEIQEQYNLFEGALNLIPGQAYTLVCDGIEYSGTCSSTGTLKFQPESKAWNITFWDKHGLEEYGSDDYEVVQTGGDTFVITNMAGKTEFTLKGGEVKVIDPDLLPDNVATKEYVDDNKFSGDYNDLDNKPCYTSVEPVSQVFFEETECTFRETFVSHLGGTRTYYYVYGIDFPKTFVPGDTYTVIIDGTQYENLISYIPERSSYSSGAIGSDDSPSFADGYPFHIETFDYLGNTLSFSFSKEFYGEGNLVHTIAIYHISPEVKLLDTKYTANKPGLAVAGQELKLYDYEMDYQTEETVVAGIGAEIFNNLKLNVASGDYSHAEGGVTTASGSYSHAEGNDTTASGLWGSHAEGSGTIASASAAHAEGSNTVASGPWGSHAEGEGTIASGWSSHAEGCNTVASKGYSHAEGYGTLASSSYQHVQGKYNIEDKASTYAHIVGNGTHDGYNENGDAIITRSNAHTLDWDGNAWYAGQVMATNLPWSTLEIGELIVEQTVLFDDTQADGTGIGYTSDIPVTFADGEKICFTFDGEQYICETRRIDQYNIYIGNGTLSGYDEIHNDKPFGVNFNKYGDIYIVRIYTIEKYAGLEVPVKIEKATGELHKLDEKYLPDIVYDKFATKEYVDDNKFSKDYNDLENKPFYTTEPQEVSIMDTFTITTSDLYGGSGDGNYWTDMETNESLVEGVEYIAVVNDTRYNCTAIAQNGIVGIGNVSISIDGAEDTGECFYYDGSYLEIRKDENTAESYTIDLYTVRPVHIQIDEKYLENKPGLKTYENTYTINNEEIIAGLGAEIFNDYEKNIATGKYSHAEGRSTKATGMSSHAEGNYTEALEDYSHAEGHYSKAIGLYSHAEGNTTKATGTESHAEGDQTLAEGSCSHAEGYKTTAGQICAHAEGRSNQLVIHALSDYSYSTTKDELLTAWENTNWKFLVAHGRNSHAEGEDNLALDDGSHAEGNRTIAYGKHSHTEGINTIAKSDNQHVQGKFNIEDSADTYAHIVGNGSSSARSNAYTLDWDGNGWFAGNVTVGEDNKVLATEEYVDESVSIKTVRPSSFEELFNICLEYNSFPAFYKIEPSQAMNFEYKHSTVIVNGIWYVTYASNLGIMMFTSNVNEYKFQITKNGLYKTGVGYLPVGNLNEYTPTSDYHPATKKYVDDSLNNMITEDELDDMFAEVYGIQRQYNVQFYNPNYVVDYQYMYPHIVTDTITGTSKTIDDADDFNSNFPAIKGKPYALSVIVLDGSLKIQTITMGGVDITATAKLDDDSFRIESVTGDILITWKN